MAQGEGVVGVRDVRGYFKRLALLLLGVALVVVVALLLATIAPDTAGPFVVVTLLGVVFALPLLAALPAAWGRRYDIGYTATAGVALLIAVGVVSAGSLQLAGHSPAVLKSIYVFVVVVAAIPVLALARRLARDGQAGYTDSGER